MPLAASLFTLSYAVAALGFLLLSGLVLVRPIRSRTGHYFLAASVISFCVYAVTVLTVWFPSLVALRPIASLPLIAWGIFILVCLRQVLAARVVTMLAIGIGIFAVFDFLSLLLGAKSWAGMFFLSHVGLSLMVCIAAEQLLRNADGPLRWAIKHLALATFGFAGFDLFFFAYALVAGAIDPTLSVVRGFVWAISCPLLAISAARNPSWDVPIHVSRTVVFHTLTIFVVGLFLLVIGALGYVVEKLGLGWSPVVQGVLLFSALLTIATALLSATFRARIRGFIDRNFYNYRFDYRHEWLGFTSALAKQEDASVFQIVVEAFQSLVDASGGALYLRRNSADYDLKYHLAISGLPANLSIAPDANSFFLRPLDLQNPLDSHQSKLTEHFLGGQDGTSARFIVPLQGGQELIGFIVLTASRSGLALDREVGDLLAVAAHQAASYVKQYLVTEELVIARQFDSFNKMSAFVVHDLKNLAAQLSLLSANAEQHKDNPEFQADMIDTVRHVTHRMRTLLEQLANGATAEPIAVVDVEKCLRNALRSKPSLSVKPTVAVLAEAPLRVLAHEDRLSRILGHLIQNADEAIEKKSGEISVSIHSMDDRLIICVEDNGCGMTEAFIKEQLFKPFVSSKARGMGIGVFESANYLREINGAINVSSTIGKGTRFEISLQRASLT